MRRIASAQETGHARDRNLTSGPQAGDIGGAEQPQVPRVMMRMLRSSLAALLLSVFGSCDSPTEPAMTHVLTVQVHGFGRGTVTSEPAGIDCRSDGGSCSMSLPRGSRITLNTTPGEHSEFAGWTQACAGTGACTVTLDGDRTTGALFDNSRLVAAEIGASGGTLTSHDGRLTLSVPAGALGGTRTLTIEKIEPGELGPEFKDVPVTHAYMLGPSGLTFAQPVEATLLSDQQPVAADSGVAGAVELLLTSTDGVLEPLEDLVFEDDGDQISTHGRLRHFSPLVGFAPFVLYQGAEISKAWWRIEGVVDEAEMYMDFPITASLTFVLPEEGTSVAEYRDESTLPLRARTPRLWLEMTTSPADEPNWVTKKFAGTIAYYCESGGTATFKAAFETAHDYDLTVFNGVWLKWKGRYLISKGLSGLSKSVRCIQRHMLEVSKSGLGEGTVTSFPEGIDCGEDCAQVYEPGRAVSLVATPAPGSRFAGWSVRCDGSDLTTIVLMDDDKLCDARFDIAPSDGSFSIRVHIPGGVRGTVTVAPGDNECSNAEDAEPRTCTFGYPEGTKVDIRALPGFGFEFGGWEGDCTGSDPAQQLDLDGDRECGATFLPLVFRYLLTVERSGTGKGSVISAPDEGITCIEGHSEEYPDGDCSEQYEQGTTVVLSAYAAAGSEFVSWTGDCTPTGVVNTVQAVMDQDRTCNARFDLISAFRTLTVVPVGGLSHDVLVTSHPEGISCGQDKDVCAAEFAEATTVRLSYNALTGSGATVKYSGDGVEDGDDYVVTMDLDRQIYAAYWYGMKVTTSGTGKGLVVDLPDGEDIHCGEGGNLCEAIFERFETISLNADPAPGSTFSKWTGDCSGTDRTIDVVMSQYRTCDAEFVLEVAGVPTLTPGVYSMGDLKEGFRATLFTGSLANLSSQLPLVGFGGGTGSEVGMFGVYDLDAGAYVLQRQTMSYVSGVVAAYEASAATSALLAWGMDGLALYSTQGSFGSMPVETRTDIRINDAVHAGGGGPSNAMLFVSPDLGVGFVRYDPGLGRYAVSEEVLPKSAFVGDLLWAYVDDANAPAVVLSRSTSSRLYFHRRDGTAPAIVATGLGLTHNMRCLPPICLVFRTSPGVPVFLFDGQNTPTQTLDAALTFIPVEAALRLTPSGTIAALIVGRESGADRVAEVEFAADGSVVRVVPIARPDECSRVNGAAYVPDGAGVAALVTCTDSHNFFTERSALFPPP